MSLFPMRGSTPTRPVLITLLRHVPPLEAPLLFLGWPGAAVYFSSFRVIFLMQSEEEPHTPQDIFSETHSVDTYRHMWISLYLNLHSFRVALHWARNAWHYDLHRNKFMPNSRPKTVKLLKLARSWILTSVVSNYQSKATPLPQQVQFHKLVA